MLPHKGLSTLATGNKLLPKSATICCQCGQALTALFVESRGKKYRQCFTCINVGAAYLLYKMRRHLSEAEVTAAAAATTVADEPNTTAVSAWYDALIPVLHNRAKCSQLLVRAL